MIYVTQFIYINSEFYQQFLEFENIVLSLLPKYNARLLIRLAPTQACILESNVPNPDEIHVLEFPSHLEFENFQNDPTRKSILNLKNISVKSSFSILGTSF